MKPFLFLFCFSQVFGEEVVSILQNRFFLKKLRPELGILAGSYLNEAYTNTRYLGLRTGIYFNEWVGVELETIRTSVSDTEDKKALDSKKYIDPDDPNRTILVSVTPEVNRIRSANHFTVVYAPFYGKLNLMDRQIVYSDLYLSAGYGQISTDQGSKGSILYGLGQRFFFGDRYSARIDFKQASYSESRGGKDSSKNAPTFNLGFSVFVL